MLSLTVQLPNNAGKSLLQPLRKKLVEAMSKMMRVPPNSIHVAFTADIASEPVEEADGSKSIIVSLVTDSPLRNDDVLMNQVITEVNRVVSGYFGGCYKIESFIVDVHPFMCITTPAKKRA